VFVNDAAVGPVNGRRSARAAKEYPGTIARRGDDVDSRIPDQADLALLGEVKGDDVGSGTAASPRSANSRAGYEGRSPTSVDDWSRCQDRPRRVREGDGSSGNICSAAQLVPYARKLSTAVSTVCGRDKRRRSVESAGGGCEQQVGDDAALVQSR